MSTQLRILCRPDVAAGFSLASVPVLEAATTADAVAALQQLLGDPSVGIVLMEEAFHDRLPDDIRRRVARRPLPMVVPFPSPQWEARPEAAESYIVELLRQVIGYRVRLR
jgi:vacuolar-type H+-ATPase subunit F/Vma7